MGVLLDLQAVLQHVFLNNMVYFGTLICPFSTKSLLSIKDLPGFWVALCEWLENLYLAWLCIINRMSKMIWPMCSNFYHLFLTVQVVCCGSTNDIDLEKCGSFGQLTILPKLPKVQIITKSSVVGLYHDFLNFHWVEPFNKKHMLRSTLHRYKCFGEFLTS